MASTNQTIGILKPRVEYEFERMFEIDVDVSKHGLLSFSVVGSFQCWFENYLPIEVQSAKSGGYHQIDISCPDRRDKGNFGYSAELSLTIGFKGYSFAYNKIKGKEYTFNSSISHSKREGTFSDGSSLFTFEKEWGAYGLIPLAKIHFEFRCAPNVRVTGELQSKKTLIGANVVGGHNESNILFRPGGSTTRTTVSPKEDSEEIRIELSSFEYVWSFEPHLYFYFVGYIEEYVTDWYWISPVIGEWYNYSSPVYTYVDNRGFSYEIVIPKSFPMYLVIIIVIIIITPIVTVTLASIIRRLRKNAHVQSQSIRAQR